MMHTLLWIAPLLAHASAAPIVEHPHPLITEILYKVPPGSDGDACPDGTRDATGDEFVELTNPHTTAIDLAGYRISDRNLGGQGEVSFTFPRFKLQPGETVLVFNGHDQKIPNAGTTEQAPRDKHDELGCFVFTAGNDSKYSAFSNKGDWVLLSDPDEKPVHLIHWGDFDTDMPAARGLVKEEITGSIDGSAARPDASSPLQEHEEINGQDFSPGVFPPNPNR